jgi:hypothetical protein
MALYENSRYTTDALVVEVVNPQSGLPTRPAYIDLRYRIDSKSRDDRIFTPDSSQEWSLLGRKIMGDARAWWIIADMSGVIDPIEELLDINEIGSHRRRLRAPSHNRFHLHILSGEVF